MRALSFLVRREPRQEPSDMARFNVSMLVAWALTPFAAIGAMYIAAWLGLPAAVAMVLGGVR